MGTTESILIDPDGHNIETKVVNGENTPATARRQRPSSNVSTLQGVVLGLPSTGKKSLLQRLKGKDPFLVSKKGDEDDPKNITIPYHAPGETFGERLQLKVEISSSFDQQPPAFYVVMINPRHDPRSLKPYLMKLLSILMTKTTGDNKALVSSVCILVNFRDEHESRPVRVSEKDIKRWIKDSKKENPSAKKFPLIETGVVSMKNCYGLLSLHRFIYQSYLSRKQKLLEDELSQVRKEMKKSQTTSNQTYKEFLEILENSSVDIQQTKKPVTRTTYGFSKPTKKSVDIKQTLDDFFADTDEEDNVVPATTLNVSNDDEEDDFYYNEGGKRMGTNKEVKPILVSNQYSSDKKQQQRVSSSKSKGLSDKSRESFKKPISTSSSSERGNVKPSSIMGKSLSATLAPNQQVKSTPLRELSDPKQVLNLGKDAVESVTSDGWSDDDDLDTSEEYNRSQGQQLGKLQTSKLKEVSSEEDEMKDGWGEDDGLSLDDDEDDKLSNNIASPVTKNEQEDGWKDDDDLELDNSKNSDDLTTKKDIGNSAQTSSMAKTAASLPVGDGWGEDDDGELNLDDENLSSERMPTNNVKPLTSHKKQILDSDTDSEDDDFMIGDNYMIGGSPDNQSSLHATTTQPLNNQKFDATSNEDKSFNTTGTGGTAAVTSSSHQGLSAATLSAIQAAEQEAQLMLGEQQQQQQAAMNMQTFDEMDSSQKKKKKKKKKQSSSSSSKKKKSKASGIE